MVDGAETAGRLSVVEHTLPSHVLAGPLHYHAREDEYSYVLEGRLGALLGDQQVYARSRGSGVQAPRAVAHLLEPGDTPTRVLELITPAGPEELFRELGAPGGELDPATLPALEARYGCQVDLQATATILQRHGLRF
jgi:mannose-6-phosphate isomerase-like protein (cupin superfamily)